MQTFCVTIYDKHFPDGFVYFKAQHTPSFDEKRREISFFEDGKLRIIVIRKKSIAIIKQE